MRIFPKDAKSIDEKIAYVIGYGFPVAFYLFAQLSAFNVFHNFFSVACKAAGWGWKIPGVFLTAILVIAIIRGFRNPRNAPSNLSLAVVAVLSIAFYAGFAYPYIF